MWPPITPNGPTACAVAREEGRDDRVVGALAAGDCGSGGPVSSEKPARGSADEMPVPGMTMPEPKPWKFD